MKLLYTTVSPYSVRYLQRTADGGFEDIPLLPAPSCCAKFAPDMRFVVYGSDVTGTHEIWVSRIPSGKGKWQVSDSGGRGARWSKDGSEIFYMEGNALVAVEVTTDPTFLRGRKRVLFRSEGLRGSYAPLYDVTADGQRFVTAEPVDDTGSVIRVVQHWYEELSYRENDGQPAISNQE